MARRTNTTTKNRPSLRTLDLLKLDLPKLDLTSFDLRKLDPRRLIEGAKSVAYAAVGVGVVAGEQLGKLADDAKERFDDLMPQVKGYARTASAQVRELLHVG